MPAQIDHHERTIAILETDVRLREAQKDAAYVERNRVVAGLCAVSFRLGWRVGKARTVIERWDPEWWNVVYIDLPTGQVSWHYHDDHASMFSFLPEYPAAWDGHDTPEKYRRLAALADS